MTRNDNFALKAHTLASKHPEKCYYDNGDYEWIFGDLMIRISEMPKSYRIYFKGEDVYLTEAEAAGFEGIMEPVLEKVKELEFKEELDYQKEFKKLMEGTTELEMFGTIPEEHMSEIDKYERDKGCVEFNFNIFNF